MWYSRTKNDLIIEVWEKLDCENVGAAEIEAISTAVEEQYGAAAVDSPMIIARLLADEGAELRHAEIMDLWIAHSAERPHDAALRNILRLESLKSAAASIGNLENLRLKFSRDGDKEGLRLLRETALKGKDLAANATEEGTEIAEWVKIWLQTPEIFKDWLNLRQGSRDYIEKFGAPPPIDE